MGQGFDALPHLLGYRRERRRGRVGRQMKPPANPAIKAMRPGHTIMTGVSLPGSRRS